jgi:GT2 family glycosyltransferase
VEKYLAHNFAYQDGRTMGKILELVCESLSARGNADSLTTPISVAKRPVFPCSIILPVDDVLPQVVLATLASIAENTPGELFEIIVIDCSTMPETSNLLSSLSGDVKYLRGEPGWSYATACNNGAAEATGKYCAFLKPGLILSTRWLEGLLEVVASESDVGVTGGVTLNENGLIWHMGIAFDVNQAPFCLYRLMPPEFSGAQKRRSFKALLTPFLTARQLYCHLGGFSTEFLNRFEDIDFCLRVKLRTGLRIVYTPGTVVRRQHVSWSAVGKKDQLNRIRFYSKWTGSVWQDDESYLREDGLTHDALSSLYRNLAERIAYGACQLSSDSATANLQSPL